MKILVTGAKGFIGRNLIAYLKTKENIEIIEYDIDNSIEEMESYISSVDFIYHLAGVNRPQTTEEFYQGNRDLTNNIINLLQKKKLHIPFLYTSSIQATKDNDYGKSKKEAEAIINQYGKDSPVYLYRLHNVFGKWCRPNYNSVIATFCYNISHDLDITINDPNAILELIYIDDIIKEFAKLLEGNIPDKTDECYYISPVYKKQLGEIANLIKTFKNNMTSISVPQTGDDFIKKLFATYVSYIDIDKMSILGKMNVDERGSFTELAHTTESGQFSVSISKPGVIRGNHYHHTKMERFIVVKGKADISFRHIEKDEIYTYHVDDTKLEIITIPPGYTHRIENTGTDEMILFLWCNEIFDKDNPDTYYMEV